MASIPFQIEVVVAEMGFVIARQLEPKNFEVGEGATLKGCPVAAAVFPPAKDEEMQARDDLRAFRLRRREDATRFKPGDVVELSGWSEQPVFRP